MTSIRSFGTRGKYDWHYRSELAFSPDGKVLAVGSHYASSVRLLDSVTGTEVQRLYHGSDPFYFAFIPKSRLAITISYDATRIWDVDSGEQTMQLELHGYRISASPDGTLLATAGTNGGEIVLSKLVWE